MLDIIMMEKDFEEKSLNDLLFCLQIFEDQDLIAKVIEEVTTRDLLTDFTTSAQIYKHVSSIPKDRHNKNLYLAFHEKYKDLLVNIDTNKHERLDDGSYLMQSKIKFEHYSRSLKTEDVASVLVYMTKFGILKEYDFKKANNLLYACLKRDKVAILELIHRNSRAKLNIFLYRIIN
jgi:hypothetical protein